MKTQHQHNMRSSCISLCLSPSSRAHAQGCWLGWILSVALRPRRRCNGAAALAPLFKSGGRRAGATVWGVFEQGAQKSSERTVIFFSPPGVWPAAASVESIMANKAQQPPYLHLAEVTASQFLDIWKHFDTDGRTPSFPPEKLCQSQYLRGLTE